MKREKMKKANRFIILQLEIYSLTVFHYVDGKHHLGVIIFTLQDVFTVANKRYIVSLVCSHLTNVSPILMLLFSSV